MSISVAGIKPADEKYRKMLEVYEACKAASVPVPDAVQKFFNYGDPEPTGVLVSLSSPGRARDPSITEYRNDYSEGFEVNLDKLDPNIRVLRFTVGY